MSKWDKSAWTKEQYEASQAPTELLRAVHSLRSRLQEQARDDIAFYKYQVELRFRSLFGFGLISSPSLDQFIELAMLASWTPETLVDELAKAMTLQEIKADTTA